MNAPSHIHRELTARSDDVTHCSVSGRESDVWGEGHYSLDSKNYQNHFTFAKGMDGETIKAHLRYFIKQHSFFMKFNNIQVGIFTFTG